MPLDFDKLQRCRCCQKLFNAEEAHYHACPECFRTEVFNCAKCGKLVYAVEGVLRCCGQEETSAYARRANRANTRMVAWAMAGMFSPIKTIYHDDGSVSYEGIPNRD